MKKALVIDDDPSDLRRMKRILEKNGFRVATAINAEEASKIIKKKHFDTVIVDIMLPGSPGYHIIRQLREKFNQKTKILIVSITPESHVDISLADAFIQKPFSPESFMAKVITGQEKGA